MTLKLFRYVMKMNDYDFIYNVGRIEVQYKEGTTKNE